MPHVFTSLTVGSLLLASASAAQPVHAQLFEIVANPPAKLAMADAGLPDAPSATLNASGTDAYSSSSVAVSGWEQGPSSAVAPQVAKKSAITIRAGESAQPLSASDKFAIGIQKQLTLGAWASWNVSAGYSHLMDNRPHYGTDRAGFGERLGAAALRDTSQSIFFYGIYANLFHDDPRYYVLGPQHAFKQRVIYAATRVIVTRKDSGGNAPNWALISAVASSSALTNAYYPDRDRSVGRTFTGLATSLAIRAGTQQLREFSAEIRQRLHLKH